MPSLTLVSSVCSCLLVVALASACAPTPGNDAGSGSDAPGAGSERDAGGDQDAGPEGDAGTEHDAGPAPRPVTALIGPEGGTLTSADGNVTLTVVAGTVAEETTFSIARLDDAPAEDRVGPAYRFGPDDVDFREPVVVSLRYDESALGEVLEEDLTMVVLDETSGQWDSVASTVDAEANVVRAGRRHFSDYALADVGRVLREQDFEYYRGALFVRQDGDDTAMGTEELPLRTLTAACRRTHGGLWEVGEGRLSYHYVDRIDLGAGEYVLPPDYLCWEHIRGAGVSSTTIVGAEGETRWVFPRPHTLADLTLRGLTLDMTGDASHVRVEMGPAQEKGIKIGVVDELIPALDDVEVVGAGLPGSVCFAVGGVIGTRLSAHGCEVGVDVDLGFGGHGSTVSESRSYGNVLGVRGARDVIGRKAFFQGTEVRNNDVGVRFGPSSPLDFHSLGGNTLSCNGLDVDAAEAGLVDASNNAWDHVPPISAEYESGNDYDGIVSTGNATLANPRCSDVADLIRELGVPPEAEDQLRALVKLTDHGEVVHSDGEQSAAPRPTERFTGVLDPLLELSPAAATRLFDSAFPCGAGSHGTTFCASAAPPPAGQWIFLVTYLAEPFPLDDATGYYQHAFVFDADGVAENNYAAPPEYPRDFFDGSDLWFELLSDPTNGRRVVVRDFRLGLMEVPSQARFVVAGRQLGLFVPLSELTADAAFRTTAFWHTGDYGLSGGPWSADYWPVFDEPYAPIATGEAVTLVE